jgi:HEAT repeat protein
MGAKEHQGSNTLAEANVTTITVGTMVRIGNCFQSIAVSMVILLGACNSDSLDTEKDESLANVWPTKDSIPTDTTLEIRTLIEKTLSQVPRVRFEAAVELGKAGRIATPAIPFLVRLLGDSSSPTPGPATVGMEARRALDNIGEPAVVPLIAALGDQRLKAGKSSILSLLASLGDRRAVSAIVTALSDKDPDVRWHAARALVDMPDPRAFEPLMRCIGDSDSRVAGVAVSALGEIGDRRAVEPLIVLLVRNRDAETKNVGIRRAAARALGRLGDLRTFEPLLAAYEDNTYPERGFPDTVLRDYALEALGHTRAPRAFDILRRALKEGDATERVAAVRGLGGLRDSQSIAALIAVLRSERPTTKWSETRNVPLARPAAALALVDTGDDTAIDAVLDEYRGASGSHIREHMEGGAKDIHFRTAAVDALAMSPQPKAYLKIIDILEGSDNRMRREAARILCCSTLSQILSETDAAFYKRCRLSALNDSRVLRELMKVAASAPPSKQADQSALTTFRETQKYAIGALRKSGNPEALRFVEKVEREGQK